MGPAISKGSFKSEKTIHYLTCPSNESSKIFVSFLWPVFVYNAVDLNKIATAFLAIPPP